MNSAQINDAVMAAGGVEAVARRTGFDPRAVKAWIRYGDLPRGVAEGLGVPVPERARTEAAQPKSRPTSIAGYVRRPAPEFRICCHYYSDIDRFCQDETIPGTHYCRNHSTPSAAAFVDEPVVIRGGIAWVPVEKCLTRDGMRECVVSMKRQAGICCYIPDDDAEPYCGTAAIPGSHYCAEHKADQR